MDFSRLFESQLGPSYLATDRLGQACDELNLSRVLVWRCCCFHVLLQTRWEKISLGVHQCGEPAIP